MTVLGTQNKNYIRWRNRQSEGLNNGAYWYAKEIEEIILPELQDLDLFVVTTGATLMKDFTVPCGAVILCHDNRKTRRSYERLFRKGVLWVCSKYSTVQTLLELGEKAVYIPLSIDTHYVAQFKQDKTEDIAFVGNAWGFKHSYLASLPKDIVQLSGMEREDLLREMAKFKRIIAEGRCLMEAQVLGADTEVPKYDNLESVFVEALDSRDAISYWREALTAHAETLKKRDISAPPILVG